MLHDGCCHAVGNSHVGFSRLVCFALSECCLAQAQGEQVYLCGGFENLVVGDQRDVVL